MVADNEFDRLFSSEKHKLILSLDSLVSKEKESEETISDINLHLDVFKDYFLIVKIGSALYHRCGRIVVELAQKYGYEVMIEANYFSSQDDIKRHFFTYVELAPHIILLDAKYNTEELQYIKSLVEDIAFSFSIKAPTLLVTAKKDNEVLKSIKMAEKTEIDGVLMSKGELNSIIYENRQLSQNLLFAIEINFIGEKISRGLMQINNAISNGAKLIILSGDLLFVNEKEKQEEIAAIICRHTKSAEEVLNI